MMRQEKKPPPMAEWQNLQYHSGFGNFFESEALEDALPKGQNNPQVCPYGLYAEQISGTAFTAPRRDNQRTWMYRIRPSVTHEPFRDYGSPNSENGSMLRSDFETARWTPNQLRWSPFQFPDKTSKLNFVDGLKTICGYGSPNTKEGLAVHVYTCNQDMEETCLCNSDGDFLIVPQQGHLMIETEMGNMLVSPGEIAVIQRGIRFQVFLENDVSARGYVLEIFAGHFALPDLGLIGANGLANPRDFLTPKARFEDRKCTFTVINKFAGQLFGCKMDHSPFNVVAWHGNYAPYKYDLARFCPLNSVAFDHPDPSIFTVLTCPSPIPGTATADFVIFPPRWAVAENTFRPPYFHRNTMSEFMGLIRGVYDGKSDAFAPGGASLHQCMTPHGPDTQTFEAASSANLKPQKLSSDALAFMFEFNGIPKIFPWALEAGELQDSYYKCWQGLKSNFVPSSQNGHKKGQNPREETQTSIQQQGPA